MNIETAIQEVQSLYSKGVQSKDSRLVPRHIYKELLTARSTIFIQKINKRQKISDNCYQTLPSIELEKVPIATNSGILVLRSKFPLPNIIQNLDKPVIQYVTQLEGQVRFEKTEFENIKYITGNKFTGNKPKFFIKNRHLHVTVLTMLKAVSMNGLFEDPIQASIFPTFGEINDCECKDVMTLDFHTDEDSFKSISALAKQELIVMFGQMKEDKNANASDDFDTSGKMIHQSS